MGALDGRHAIVTGAGRGIGAAIAVALDTASARMWDEHLATPGVEDAVVGVIPQRRLTGVDEIASVVLFLASDASSAVTGEVLAADGGMGATVNLWPTV